MRFFSRAFSGLLLLLAVIALVSDLTRFVHDGGLATTPLMQHWLTLSPTSLQSLGLFVQNNLHGLLWDPLLLTILRLPTWLVLGIIGIIFGLLGKRREKVNVFAN